MTDTILLAFDGPRAAITLNNPAVHNRLSPSDLTALSAAVDEVARRADLRVLTITGAGEKTFCSGFDLGALPGGARETPREGDSLFQTTVDRIEALPIPTVAALNGSVYGGATDLALSCDFRIGAEGMKLVMPAGRIGIHYYPSGLRRATERLGPDRAKRLFLLGEEMSAAALSAMGYLTHLVPRADWSATVESVVSTLASRAPLALSGMKRAIDAFARRTVDESAIRAEVMRCYGSEDLREGLKALAEKRTPAFRAR